jgi:hypothetical protein
MDSLRRVGGEMEPIRRPAGPRALLPAEVEMCQVLGITEADYWVFVDLAQAHNGERKEGYELIPDIRCDAVVTPILINLAIGVALTAVGVLLAPKPKSPGQQKAPPQLQTADATGPKRFATQAGFNTVQSVASLGEVIPLVFADYSLNQGGVRVSSRLLWSRMTSWGTTQQFEGIYLFSSGAIAARPEFEGFAIGDSLITSYPSNKLRLIFGTDGGRPRKAVNNSPTGMGQYPNTAGTDTRIGGDGFEIFRPNVGAMPDFCGTRTPSSQTQFGAYAPMPNGMAFQIPYELILIPDGQGRDVKNRARQKRTKQQGYYPIGAGITAINGNIQSKGTTITYQITTDLYDGSNFGDWGRVDINQEQETRRVEIDSNIGIGSSYLVGQTLTTCTAISTEKPYDNDTSKTYTFAVSEASSSNNLDLASILGTDDSYENLTIQRVAVASISNSRPCNVTEIGLRSNVWKQINFANVNTQPSDSTITDFEEEGGNITLGRINKYINRYSFFGLQARVRGASTWTSLTGTNAIFCIKGNTPQDQYNYLFIEHPLGQYEFRLVPIPGNGVYKFWLNSSNKIWQLRPKSQIEGIAVSVPGAPGNGQFKLYFSAVEVANTDATFFNKEWIIGENLSDTGRSLNPYDALADYIKYSSENTSHSSGPEHEVVYVNEVIYNDGQSVGLFPVYSAEGPTYDNLAIAGLNLWSDKEWSSLSELSAFFKYGVSITKPNGTTGPTNLLPEIVYALLTNDTFGAGKLIGADQVNAAEMANAAEYCRTNGFTWNGVLTDRVNLREWIFENAAYCLLDFTIIGGKFSLRPTPITNSSGAILRSAKPTISALFTDGNIRDLKVVFLDPEERKPFKAVCLYREDSENGFPETRVVTVRASGGSPAIYLEEAGDRSSDPEETFDMTQFCTVPPGQYPTHPVTFAQVAIRTRTLVTHSVTFQTTPEMAMGLEPGEYFRLVSEVTHTSRFNNGAVSADGVVTSTTLLSNGSYSVYYWTPGSTVVSSGSLQISNGIASNLRGTIFTLRNSTTEDRVYKLESLSYAEDGLVEVTGSHVPLTSTGALAIMDDRGFVVETA